jgi:outer membrane murein-binding lipoprotein Lpp
MKLTLTALVAALALAGCSRSLAIEKELDSAVSELDNAIWKDGLKPIVPGVDVPKALK